MHSLTIYFILQAVGSGTLPAEVLGLVFGMLCQNDQLALRAVSKDLCTASSLLFTSLVVRWHQPGFYAGDAIETLAIKLSNVKTLIFAGVNGASPPLHGPHVTAVLTAFESVDKVGICATDRDWPWSSSKLPPWSGSVGSLAPVGLFPNVHPTISRAAQWAARDPTLRFSYPLNGSNMRTGDASTAAVLAATSTLVVVRPAISNNIQQLREARLPNLRKVCFQATPAASESTDFLLRHPGVEAVELEIHNNSRLSPLCDALAAAPAIRHLALRRVGTPEFNFVYKAAAVLSQAQLLPRLLSLKVIVYERGDYQPDLRRLKQVCPGAEATPLRWLAFTACSRARRRSWLSCARPTSSCCTYRSTA